jgi:hypothetical protein
MVLPVLIGCGTTRSTDTMRTATEQLLISDAIDRAVQEVDFRPLSGQTVYLDSSMLEDVTDRNYLVSTVRQHLLASGCTLRNERDEADFIVEARAGAVGTDRNDLLFGIPATNVPQILPLQGMPAAIPEVPLAKRRDQRGIAKISMFAYHRESGHPVWQSGLAVRESSSNDVWVFGAGPFEHGTLHKSTMVVARSKEKSRPGSSKTSGVNLAQQATFTSPAKIAQQFRRLPAPAVVAQAPQPAPAATVLPPLAPEPTPHFERTTPSHVPGLAEAAASAKDVPKLTGGIFEMETMRRDQTKTATRTTQESPSSDVIALPQPRFDSL